eukprot:TRINITY_DN22879_c0_g1_i1.p1 TRINITY_DN22879_c0_g1~~TRINITY_DN22879_c0_g1_i1.p1  ORF type:complete len:780 (+),score=164.87 TRINITY_DN22879_c0_g1_i1:81-2342(+)
MADRGRGGVGLAAVAMLAAAALAAELLPGLLARPRLRPGGHSEPLGWQRDAADVRAQLRRVAVAAAQPQRQEAQEQPQQQAACAAPQVRQLHTTCAAAAPSERQLSSSGAVEVSPAAPGRPQPAAGGCGGGAADASGGAGAAVAWLLCAAGGVLHMCAAGVGVAGVAIAGTLCAAGAAASPAACCRRCWEHRGCAAWQWQPGARSCELFSEVTAACPAAGGADAPECGLAPRGLRPARLRPPAATKTAAEAAPGPADAAAAEELLAAGALEWGTGGVPPRIRPETLSSLLLNGTLRFARPPRRPLPTSERIRAAAAALPCAARQGAGGSGGRRDEVRVAVLTRDDAAVVAGFVAHHLAVGAAHVYVYYDPEGDVDVWMALRPLAEAGLVTLVVAPAWRAVRPGRLRRNTTTPTPPPPGVPSTLLHHSAWKFQQLQQSDAAADGATAWDALQELQAWVYTDAAVRARRAVDANSTRLWLGLLDTDEWLYPGAHRCIGELLRSLPRSSNRGGLYIPWTSTPPSPDARPPAVPPLLDPGGFRAGTHRDRRLGCLLAASGVCVPLGKPFAELSAVNLTLGAFPWAFPHRPPLAARRRLLVNEFGWGLPEVTHGNELRCREFKKRQRTEKLYDIPPECMTKPRHVPMAQWREWQSGCRRMRRNRCRQQARAADDALERWRAYLANHTRFPTVLLHAPRRSFGAHVMRDVAPGRAPLARELQLLREEAAEAAVTPTAPPQPDQWAAERRAAVRSMLGLR